MAPRATLRAWQRVLPGLMLAAALAVAAPLRAQSPPGVVCNVKVVSDKVADVSDLAAWKASTLAGKTTDRQKALAIWESVVAHQHQDSPPREYLSGEAVVIDPLKTFHVYGYSFCSVAASQLAALAEQAGLRARGWTISRHCVAEVFWNDGWHLLDASLINYFPKADSELASVAEIVQAVSGWLQDHPDLKGDDAKLREFGFADNKTGWKRGPELLSRSPWINERGWWPARTHGWYSTMQEYDGSTLFEYRESCSLGYRVNVQLRPGERLTRNWSHKGLHVNADGGGKPGCLDMAGGSGAMVYTPRFGDIAPGRVGNGTHEYEVTRSDGLARSAWQWENLRARPLVGDAAAPFDVVVRDAAKPGVLVVRMPSSYVYLTGTLTMRPAVAAGGALEVFFSDNNGTTWRKVSRQGADETIDLTPLVLRRYDYLLKFVLTGEGTSLADVRITHDIQHSQRPLPALGQGANTITFSAGPAESTLSLEGSLNPASQGKQVLARDFNPAVEGFDEKFVLSASKGHVTFPVAAPGELVRLRMGTFWRAWAPRDVVEMQVSFDDGKTFRPVDRVERAEKFMNRYVEVTDIPAGARAAQVRFAAARASALHLQAAYVKADYRPAGAGFRPVRITYVWDEAGQEKRHVHVAKEPQEMYTITCPTAPTMKSLVVELAP